MRAVGRGALETLAMSGLGTLLAMVLGMLLALPAAGRFGWPLQGLRGCYSMGCGRFPSWSGRR